MSLTRGEFVRVRQDAEFRPGQDGLVLTVDGATLGIVFGCDRHNRSIEGVWSVGIEAWDVSELDLDTRTGPVLN